MPSLEGPIWYVIDSLSGDVVTTIETKSGSHNTVYGSSGARVYLAGLKSPILRVADTRTREVVLEVGPFSEAIRPFTVNARETRCYVNVNNLLGFEVGDLQTGKVLAKVRVEGFKAGPTKRHGCPSHGIGLSPDEKQVWVTDAFNQRLHIFDNSAMPPKYLASVELSDQPGWVTFSIDGQYAYPSTGDVVDTRTRKVIAMLKDEQGRPVQSEKLLEIDFGPHGPVRSGDQFGIGRAGQ